MKRQKSNEEQKTCKICGKSFPLNRMFPVHLIRASVLQSAKTEYPDLSEEDYICHNDLRRLRTAHVEKLLKEDKGALSTLDKKVLKSLKSQTLLAENVNKKFEKVLTFGEKISDKVAHFGGSWKFIISFLSMLILWMIINSLILLIKPFDPFPFILLNLILSCLAAIQAPIIMMSQNRQAEKDRLQANEEYCTNLKAELEIQQLHAKLDLFMNRQWETLVEMQQVQFELFDEILPKKRKD